MYTLFYVLPGDAGTYSVLAEDYTSIGDPEAIEGSERLVSGNLTHAEAQSMADARQRASFALTRKAQADAQAD